MHASSPVPRPKTLRLLCARGASARPPRPPFGLRTWSEAPGAALAVLLDLPHAWPASGLGDVGLVAEQLPDPASLEPGQLVVVLSLSPPSGRWLGRLVHPRPWAAGAVRASALLVRGYVGISAGIDPSSRQDLVWAQTGATPP